MEQFVDLLKEVNIVQIFIVLAGVWVFYNRLDKKIEKLDSKIEKLDSKVEKLNEKVDDVDRRLCRIEGSLATQRHCLFNQTKSDQKAQ